MISTILSALDAINVNDLDYKDWILVGMALKNEGYPCSTWDEWSKCDSRYHSGECEKKWNSFHGSSSPITGGTIIQMAKERGWKPADNDACLEWNDVIHDSNITTHTNYSAPASQQRPSDELMKFLTACYDPNDYVAYVTGDVRQNDDGKWHPGKGDYDRTAGELTASLKKHPDDIGATFGDWNPEAGAWIHINPMDGKGVRDANVTKFKFALVESDAAPISEQEKIYRQLRLPIITLVDSGGKSLHALVRVDADNLDEYRERVDYLYRYLERNGMTVDRQNGNPSRLSRMPGVTRKGRQQKLIATNIGCKSWADWRKYADGSPEESPDTTESMEYELEEADGFPMFTNLSTYKEHPPKLPEELIEGLLRCGHKMLISATAKAGKSCLLMELCVAIAEGVKWLGYQCKKGRVLYINLEIDPSSAINRFLDIYAAMGLKTQNTEDIVIWNLRGHAAPMDRLTDTLIERVKSSHEHFDAVIVDPIYKVITGDENNASAMGSFCNNFDRISAALNTSVIYAHHHSKGAQGAKRSADRASGSGVFSRDPDALLDIIELEMPVNARQAGHMSAWRMSSILREFPPQPEVNFYFDYPIHVLDEQGDLEGANYEEDTIVNRQVTNAARKRGRKEATEKAYAACAQHSPVTVKAMAEQMKISERSVRDRLKELPQYKVANNIVTKNHEEENG